MRSKTLTGAVAATAALAALAPAGAAARHALVPLKSGVCRIGLAVEPHVINSGEQVQLYGQANCPGGVTGQTITIYSRTAGSPTQKVAGTAMTGTGGFYNLVIPAGEITFDTTYTARDLTLGGKSGAVKVRVQPNVTFEGPKTPTLKTGRANAVMFTGQVTPNIGATGDQVLLQRSDALTGETWHTIGAGTVGANGLYSIIHTFVFPGDANLRTIVRPFGKFTVRGVSSPLTYGISQTQNPALLIESTTDPITVGGSTMIKGTVLNAADKTPVTLLSRNFHSSWTVVSTGTTTGSAYSFTVSPTKSAQYRVTSGKTSSASLFEGVRYGLTAGVSGTTVEAGQTLTFSGTVTGASVGKAVYLERKNTFGDGWHVVDVGAVAGDGTSYSIMHAMFGFGKETFRVKVPGDPGNQGVASSPFTIEVTAGQPTALLRPHLQPKLPG